MSLSAQKITTIISFLKSNPNLNNGDKEKFNLIKEQLLSQKDTIMPAISIHKINPALISIDELVESCKKKHPLLLDELMTLPGVNVDQLRGTIIESLNLKEAMIRLDKWYQNEIPVAAQYKICRKIYSSAISQLTEGQYHKRELNQETGDLYLKALNWVGTKITEIDAALSLYRIGHYILRGMDRQIELDHFLPESFPDTVLKSIWSLHDNEPSDQLYVNAISLTLVNKNLFKDLEQFLMAEQPSAYKEIKEILKKDGKDITKYLTSLKKDFDIKSTVVAKTGSFELNV